MSDFQPLAQSCGIALPDLLVRLLAEGKTRYGKDREDWQKEWRNYSLSAQPALSCVYDLEWIDAQEAAEFVEQWLNPDYQNGRRFLPFAQSGAGDAYCLTPMADGQMGVAFIWHDQTFSEVESLSFAEFVYRLLVESARDVEHQLESDFDLSDARQCVIANLRLFDGYLPEPLRTGLERVRVLIEQREADSPALISAEEARVALAVLPPSVVEKVSITASWECEPS